MIYTILKPILWVLFKLGLRLNVEGTENIPQAGPLVIASNHLSLLDPPVIGVAATRKVHFMAKQELFVPILGDIYKALGAFPVRRGGADRAAIKHGIDILKDNKVLAIFPEGTRSLGGEKFLPFKSGAKVLTEHFGLRVQPVVFCGTRKCLDIGAMRFDNEAFIVKYLPSFVPEGEDWFVELKEKMQKEYTSLYSQLFASPNS